MTLQEVTFWGLRHDGGTADRPHAVKGTYVEARICPDYVMRLMTCEMDLYCSAQDMTE